MKGVRERIEKIITIIKDREFSDKYPNYGWAWSFKDEDNNEYEWNTVTIPELSLLVGEKWRVRMTIKTEHEVLGFKYKRVERVNFVEQIK